MATEKDNRTAAEIIQKVNVSLGMINIDGAWYMNMESYREIQAEKPARVARRAQLATAQKAQKTK